MVPLVQAAYWAGDVPGCSPSKQFEGQPRSRELPKCQLFPRNGFVLLFQEGTLHGCYVT